MLQRRARAEAEVLPAGLRHLHCLAQALTCLETASARNLRVIITVPTPQLAGVVVTLGATLVNRLCRDCPHTRLEVGARVTGWLSGEFIDASLDRMSDEELMFAGVHFRGDRGSVHRLPEGFPERSRWRLPDELRREVAEALKCNPEIAGQRLSASAAHPVVVVGEWSTFLKDVDLLAKASPVLHVRGRMHSGRLEEWFRHPVLTERTIPQPERIPWARELQPRLILFTGSAAWARSSRSVWPNVPIILLLSRRSPAASRVASVISVSGWPAPRNLPPTLVSLLKPTAGLEIFCRIEPETTCDEEDMW